MKQVIDVPTGKVAFGSGKTVLRAPAIGSCVVVAVYSSERKAGALAHVMLPGSAPDTCDPSERTKYAADAVAEILRGAVSLGADLGNVEVCLIGGANILNEPNMDIGKENARSVIGLLKERRILVKAQALGGTQRRAVTFDLEDGSVVYAEGDKSERLLWKPGMLVEGL